MSDLDRKRDEIAALVALDLGFGDLETLSDEERAGVESATAKLVAAEPGDAASQPAPLALNMRLQRALAEYQDLKALRADEDNTRLAEEGEVFAPENDA